MLEVDETPENWMILIMSYYNAQDKVINKKFNVIETSTFIPPFDGTFYVSDIRFNKKPK